MDQWASWTLGADDDWNESEHTGGCRLFRATSDLDVRLSKALGCGLPCKLEEVGKLVVTWPCTQCAHSHRCYILAGGTEWPLVDEAYQGKMDGQDRFSCVIQVKPCRFDGLVNGFAPANQWDCMERACLRAWHSEQLDGKIIPALSSEYEVEKSVMKMGHVLNGATGKWQWGWVRDKATPKQAASHGFPLDLWVRSKARKLPSLFRLAWRACSVHGLRDEASAVLPEDLLDRIDEVSIHKVGWHGWFGSPRDQCVKGCVVPVPSGWK
jgi:hypothetical protein